MFWLARVFLAVRSSSSSVSLAAGILISFGKAVCSDRDGRLGSAVSSVVDSADGRLRESFGRDCRIGVAAIFTDGAGVWPQSWVRGSEDCVVAGMERESFAKAGRWMRALTAFGGVVDGAPKTGSDCVLERAIIGDVKCVFEEEERTDILCRIRVCGFYI